LCNGYTDQDVRRAAAAGHTTVDAAYESLGNGPCCGSCKCFAQDMIDETMSSTAQAMAVAAE